MYVLLHRNKNISQVKSIAVPPLENLSGDPAQEYFADGITDELITALAKIHSMKVISRTSAMQYKGVRKPLPQIARELGVDSIVEGTVTRFGSRVRITAQLIDAHRDRHLWAENYDRDVGDVVTLQNQIARAIADEIRAKLTPEERSQLARERPVNPAAHEAYLKGRFHWNKRTEEELRTGIDYFNQAVAADPRYAEAYVGLADSYNILGSWVFTSVPVSEARANAMTYASKALTIDDTLGEAHTSLANMKLLFDWDWEGSEAEFERAIVLSPNYANARHWHAELLLDLGRFDESIREGYKAKELDPLAPMMSSGVAHRLCAAGRLEEAIPEAKSALELNPDLPLAHMDLGDVYLRQANYAEAIAEFKKTVQLSNGNPNFIADLAYAYAASGDRDHAWELLKGLQQMSRSRYVPTYQLAVVFAGLGEKRTALQALDQAYKEHSPWMNNLLFDRRLDNLRKESEFVRILAAMKFPDNGRLSTAKH